MKNKKTFDDKPARKKHYKNLNSEHKALTKIYIGNMNYEMDEGDINKIFTKYGKVGKINIIRDKKTNRSKGIGFFQMFNKEDAKQAINAVNGKVVMERTLKVSVALER